MALQRIYNTLLDRSNTSSEITRSAVTAKLPLKVLDIVFRFLIDDHKALSSSRLVCKNWNDAASVHHLAECTFVGSKKHNFERYLDDVEKSQSLRHIKQLTLKCIEFSMKATPDRVTHLRVDTFDHFRARMLNLERVVIDVPVISSIDLKNYLYGELLTGSKNVPIMQKRPPAERALAWRPLQVLKLGEHLQCGMNGHALGATLEDLPPMEQLIIEYVLEGCAKLQRNHWNTRRLQVQRLEAFNVTRFRKLRSFVRDDFLTYVDSLAVLVPSPAQLMINFGHAIFAEKFGPNLTSLYLTELDLNDELYTPHILRLCPKLKLLAVACNFGVLYTDRHENVWAEFLSEAINDAPALEEVGIICKPQKFRGVANTEFIHTQLAPCATKEALMAPIEEVGRAIESRKELKMVVVAFDMSVTHTYGRDEHEEFEKAVESEVKTVAVKYPRAKSVLQIIVESKFSGGGR